MWPKDVILKEKSLRTARSCVTLADASKIRAKNGDKTLTRVDVYGWRWELIEKVCREEGNLIRSEATKMFQGKVVWSLVNAMNKKMLCKILILKCLFKIRTIGMFVAELAESDEEIGINADILVDRRRGFYWCKVSGQERILQVLG
jgi:hypothetical protein